MLALSFPLQFLLLLNPFSLRSQELFAQGFRGFSARPAPGVVKYPQMGPAPRRGFETLKYFFALVARAPVLAQGLGGSHQGEMRIEKGVLGRSLL